MDLRAWIVGGDGERATTHGVLRSVGAWPSLEVMAGERSKYKARTSRNGRMLMDIASFLTTGFGLIEQLGKVGKRLVDFSRGRARAKSKRSRGQRLAEARRQCGKARYFADELDDGELSAQVFGAAAGIEAIDHLHDFEKGQASLALKDLRALCGAWNLSENHLLDGLTPAWAHMVNHEHDIFESLHNFDESIVQLFPVRVRAPDGHVAFILQRHDWRNPTVIHFPNFHFGAAVGGGGAHDQFEFYLVRAALDPESRFFPAPVKENATALRDRFGLKSRMPFLPGLETSAERFAALVEGRIHPLAFLQENFWEGRANWFNFYEDVFHQSPIAPTYEQELGADFVAAQRNAARIATKELLKEGA